MSDSKSNFEGNLILMCLASVFGSFYITKMIVVQTCLHWHTFKLNMKPVFPVGIFETMFVLIGWFWFIWARYTIKFT